MKRRGDVSLRVSRVFRIQKVERRRIGWARYLSVQAMLGLFVFSVAIAPVLIHSVAANALSAGGDTAVVDPNTGEPVSILENAREPEAPNIRLSIPTLSGDGADDGAYYATITSVNGGTLKDSIGGGITVGDPETAATWLYTNGGGYVDFWFTPTANRSTAASFTYVLIHDAGDGVYEYSAPSTATIPITPVDVAPTLTTANGWTGTGLTGTYYRTDYNLTGDSSTRVDPSINFDTTVEGPCSETVWGMEDICPDDFSVRWTGQVKAPEDGDYSFMTTSDDGVRLWVDGQLLVDNWTTHASQTDYAANTLHFTAGSTHDIELDYYERGGGETITLNWAHDANLEDYEVVPTADLYPGTIRPQLTYVVGSSATPVDDGVSINDVDSTTMSGATIAIINNFTTGQDQLQFTNQNGITGSYNATNGVMTLSGTATVAQYQAAMRSVKYFNASGAPNTDTRTVQFQVNDGEKDSNFTTRDIAFSTENSPPNILQGSSTDVTMDEDADSTPFTLALDADDPNFDALSWNIQTQAAHGTASVDSTGSTVNVHYTPTLHYSGSDSFVVRVSDGNGGTDTITVNVTVTPFTDNDNITTAVEDAAPHSGDGNNDGTLDSRQSNVSSLVGDVSNHYVTLAVDDACDLSDVSSQAQDVNTPDAGYTYPLGLINFTANCGTNGFTTTVKQYFYNPPAGTFALRKLTNGVYSDVPDATQQRTTIGGVPVLIATYGVTDGGALDADGEQNGVIVDPVGLAVAATAESSDQNSSALADTGVDVRIPTIAAMMLVLGSVASILLVRRAIKRD